jgi:hypothetical protein
MGNYSIPWGKANFISNFIESEGIKNGVVQPLSSTELKPGT